MKLSGKSISELGKIITGDGRMSLYRTGYDLVQFFNQFGFKDFYEEGFPSRWKYAEDKLNALNGNRELERVIQAALDPRDFYETPFSVVEAAKHLNYHLGFDGYELVKGELFYGVRPTGGSGVKLASPFAGSPEVTHVFINQQIEKCDRKIAEGDFDGAITNARSLVEAVFKHIETELDPAPPDYDGDLLKLYKRVQKLLNLDPAQKDLADTLRQILGGLTSIVTGLAGLRNKMSDAHAPQYRPSEHHAKLAVNAAKTLADFIFETYEYQQQGGGVGGEQPRKAAEVS